MTDKERIKLSKFMSLVLRHQPQTIGIELDSQGWVSVDALIAGMNRHRRAVTLEQIREVVATSDKQRYALSADGLRIRANQGHSVEVDLAYEPATPPELLYHGTATRFVADILSDGLLKMSRHHVHLSPDHATAIKVGQRHGKPVVLIVQSAAMHRDGSVFFHSANGVWLTEHVPAKYLSAKTKA